MTKAEIVSHIANGTGIEKTTISTVVESFMESVKENMINGENIYLRGFGSFVIKQRAEKVARNITKNTTVIVPARSIPSFKPAKEFMAKVKGKK
ncbi:integration host factor subunit beta [Bacteroides thetaiotaomicron]|uniref:HU family DNA-binding protein n=1 Tax=Bacteroides thetaiotaomicron TaxID=818 RepID=UPI001C8C0D0D|nr:HU family DNA-binding protein [Bacteroides thetaiotaomicron]MBX9049642.1 integration host factor subunit beta [Bacteroides thetaiotaomicron]MBX9072932.1 integration host factor subunit beta [Bacteroides thetaiotaomicron]